MLEIEIIHFDNVGNNEAEDFFCGNEKLEKSEGEIKGKKLNSKIVS